MGLYVILLCFEYVRPYINDWLSSFGQGWSSWAVKVVFKCQWMSNCFKKNIFKSTNQTHPASLSTCPRFYFGGGGGVSFAQSPSLVSDRFSLHIVNIETLKLFLYLNTCWSMYSYPKNNLLTIIIWVECLYHHRWVKWMKQFMWALHTPTKLLKQGRR